jgi:hypothetical protein
MTVSDWINTAIASVTAIGVLAAFWQIQISTKTNRAIFLKDLYLELRSEEIGKAFYLIEYGKFKYDESFHESENEILVDRLLTLVDLVCDLHLTGNISKKEMKLFQYQFMRIFKSTELRKYLNFLDNFYKINDVDKSAFSSFQKYMKSQVCN